MLVICKWYCMPHQSRLAELFKANYLFPIVDLKEEDN